MVLGIVLLVQFGIETLQFPDRELSLQPAHFFLFFAVLSSLYLCVRVSVTGTVLPSLTSMPRLTGWKPFNFSAIT